MLSPVETGDNSCTQRVKTLSCAIGTTTTINAVIPRAGPGWPIYREKLKW